MSWPTDIRPHDDSYLIFTDGSCLHPNHEYARSAAFAIVIYDPTKQHDAHGFRLIGAAECSNQQSINRAELLALVEVAVNQHAGTVVSDSQYALTAVHMCRTAQDHRFLHKHANYDLLQKLWHALQNSQLAFEKIKSHQPLECAKTDAEAIRIYGNALADSAAQQAVHRYRKVHPRYADLAEEEEMQANLQKVWTFRYGLMKKRAQLSVANSATEKVTIPGEPVPTLVQSLKLFAPYNPDQPNLCIPDELLRWSLWGTAYSRDLFAWMKQLKWNPNPDNDRASQVGVSWLELALSFIWATSRIPPVNLGGRGRKMKTITYSLEAPPLAAECSFAKITNHFRCAVEHLLKAATSSPEQWHQRTKIRTHYYYGAKCGAQGIRWRPSFPHQKQVIEHLQKYFADSGPQCTWHQWPEFHTIPIQPFDLAEEDELPFRYRYQVYLSHLAGD